MTSDAPFQAGDVVVVPFPYSDRLTEKRRPALVVSGPATHDAGYVWLVMITSSQNQGFAGDRPISDPTMAGLSSASIVRPVKIASIEPSRIMRRAGRLSKTDWRAVRQALEELIAP